MVNEILTYLLGANFKDYFIENPEYLKEVTILKRPASTAKEARKWYNRLLKAPGKLKTRKMKPGFFYAFQRYDAKGWEEGDLPFFDLQPMILNIGTDGKYSLGINIHYLPPSIRQAFINKLIKENPGKMANDKPIKHKSWTKIKGITSYAPFMVKRYINDRISGIIRIPNNQIKNVINLKSDKFIGISPGKLWKMVTGKSPGKIKIQDPTLLKPKKGVPPIKTLPKNPWFF